jgi:DNA repair protein RecN (Recombination protein N)
MLSELRIQNFAIIDKLELCPGDGLIILTGETGAGKSIILDAVEIIVGGRADATAIRTEADSALVEGTFRLTGGERQPVTEILQREELLDDSNYLTLTREVRREGRNLARINGRMVSVGLLKELGGYLVDIHGQSEHLSLLDVHAHLGLLDRYADVRQQLGDYRSIYHKLMEVRRELSELRQAQADTERRTELLSFQAQEIELAKLRPGEDVELRQERDRLANAEALDSLTQETLVALDEGTPEAPAASDLIGRAVAALASLAKIDSSQNPLSEQASLLSENLADLARALRDYLEGVEFNPKRLEQVEERLDLISRLERKYGGSIQAAIDFAAQARQQLENITHASERTEQLEAEEAELLKELALRGEALSRKRQQAAVELSHGIEAELKDLRMSNAQFSVDFQTKADKKAGVPMPGGQRLAFDASGLDRVEFLVAPNPGEGLKPLAKIASGGETSRLMLALKNVLARADEIPSLIFDEIDQGIGGRAGAVVGQKLWGLARQHQVFCVTHLPQLAAFGDQHWQVQKIAQEGRTLTRVELLKGESRLLELAQMLGEVSEGTIHSAHEILQTARSLTGSAAEV